MRKLSLRLKHLSQEHQVAMRLAMAARESGQNSEQELEYFAAKLRKIFEQEIEPHFQEEEHYALPRLREIGRNDLAERTLDEHQRLRAIVRQLQDPNAELVKDFSQTLQAHVEFEESVVWDVLEAAMDAAANRAA